MPNLVLAARTPERENYLGDAFNLLAFCRIIEGEKAITVSRHGQFVPAKVEKREDHIAFLTIDRDPYALFAPAQKERRQ